MMKKLLFIAVCVLGTFTSTIFAQTNLDLENWDTLTNGVDVPIDWGTLNSFTFLGFSQSTFKETIDPGEGLASARLETISAPGATSLGACSDTAGGMLSIGPATPGTTIGTPYTQRPDSVKFLYKYMPVDSDMGAILVELSHYDVGLDSTITDGQGFMLFPTQDTTWTEGSVAICYFTFDTPDTLVIIASSSAVMFCNSLGVGIGAQRIGSQLWLDSFAIVITPNTPPVANDDNATTDSAVTVVIDVQSNDTDAKCGPKTISIVSGPGNGSATVVGMNIEYTPDSGFVGNDTIWYEICDDGTPPLCDTAKVIITVTSPPTGIDEITTGSQYINIFRNPTNTSLTIQSKDPADPILVIEIYNTTGQLIRRVFNVNITSRYVLKRKGLPSGLYMINVKSKEHNVMKKVMFE